MVTWLILNTWKKNVFVMEILTASKKKLIDRTKNDKFETY